MPRRTAALTLFATLGVAGLVGLSGCTGAPAAPSSSTAGTGTGGSSQQEDAGGDAGQSTQDACALVQDTISDATARFESAGSEDPAAVIEAMNAAANQLAEAAPQITNDEVAALIPSLQGMFTQAGEVMTAVVAGDTSKIEDLAGLGTSFQETSEAFQKVCAP